MGLMGLENVSLVSESIYLVTRGLLVYSREAECSQHSMGVSKLLLVMPSLKYVLGMSLWTIFFVALSHIGCDMSHVASPQEWNRELHFARKSERLRKQKQKQKHKKNLAWKRGPIYLESFCSYSILDPSSSMYYSWSSVSLSAAAHWCFCTENIAIHWCKS